MNRRAPFAPRAPALLLVIALAGACAMGGRREPEPPPDVVREDKARIEDARRSIARLEEQVGVPVRLVGVGPGRDQYVHFAA